MFTVLQFSKPKLQMWTLIGTIQKCLTKQNRFENISHLATIDQRSVDKNISCLLNKTAKLIEWLFKLFSLQIKIVDGKSVNKNDS